MREIAARGTRLASPTLFAGTTAAATRDKEVRGASVRWHRAAAADRRQKVYGESGRRQMSA